MTINIEKDPESRDLSGELRSAILEVLPAADVSVVPGGTGHFSIRVVAQDFEGLGRVKQQQLVYGAIAHLMSGTTPPVHAIDRLECETS